MIDEADLRASLAAHAQDVPSDHGRAADVQRRIARLRRRRRAAAGALVLVLAAAVAVPAASHRGADHHAVASPPTSRPPSPTPGPVAPPVLPAYERGGRAIARVGALVGPGDDSVTATFTPTSYLLYVQLACAGEPDADVTITVAGRPQGTGFGGDCGIGVGDATDAANGMRTWRSIFQLGRRTTITAVLRPHAGSAVLTPGGLAIGVYQGVPWASYPLPPQPAQLAPLPPPTAATTLDARSTGLTTRFTVYVRLAPKRELRTVLVGPGILDFTLDGQHLGTAASYSWDDEESSLPLDALLLNDDGIGRRNGQLVTLTVTASYFDGPYWTVFQHLLGT